MLESYTWFCSWHGTRAGDAKIFRYTNKFNLFVIEEAKKTKPGLTAPGFSLISWRVEPVEAVMHCASRESYLQDNPLGFL